MILRMYYNITKRQTLTHAGSIFKTIELISERMIIMTGYALGILIGVTIGVIILLLALKFINNDGKLSTKYDERQLKARGEAYKYGFIAVCISNGIILCCNFSRLNLSGFLGDNVFFIPILIGVVVQVTYSIFTDAYIGLNNNIGRFMLFMFIISAFNFFIGFAALANGELVKDNVLQAPFTNLLCGLLFIILAIELGIKKLYDGREE